MSRSVNRHCAAVLAAVCALVHGTALAGGVFPAEATDWTRYSPWFYAFVAGFMLCLVLFATWNRAMRKEVRRRLAVKAELRKQLAFQRALLEGIPHAVCVRDTQARLIFCNRAFEELFDTTREALMGTTVIEAGLEYASRERMALLHQRYLDLLSDHGTISEDVDVWLRGDPHKVFHWAVPISLTEGEAPMALVTGAIEVTERHQLIEQLEGARSRAEAANRAKSNFLATMSHEIRTPMNAVTGMLELMLREARLGERDRESAELARTSAQSLLGLIDDVLDISKIEAGGLEIIAAPARLGPIVEDVARMFQGLARQRGLAIDVDIDPAVAEWHLVDAARFRQIANNLVSNAIKYTDVGTVTVRLLHGRTLGAVESVTLEVEDTGIGIAPEDVKNLFQPFFQAEAAGPRTIGGTGLGLPIVKRLCVRMGGDIEVDSARGSGTCIRIRLELPLSPAPEARTASPSDTDAAAGQPWTPGEFRILAVDDHPANRLLLERQLAFLGLDCEVAEDGEAALAIWRQGGFDLVITDCSMPKMDGYALTLAIRDLERAQSLARCPVLGCTAHVLQEDRRHALEVGMDECLLKPFSLDALSTALHRYLRSGGRQANPRPQIPAQQTPAPAKPSFDPLALLGFSGGDASIETRFLEMLLRTNQGDVEELAEHVGAEKWRDAAASAHKIKGAARLVDAARVIQACETFEAACETREMPVVAGSLAVLVSSVGELNDAIATQLGSLAALPVNS